MAKNNKLTSNECKKYLKNNLYLYYRARNYKLNFYLKKQTIVTLKSYSILVATNFSTATSKKPSKNRE